MPERGEVRLIHFTPNFVSSFPVQVFAFTCAQNVSLLMRVVFPEDLRRISSYSLSTTNLKQILKRA